MPLSPYPWSRCRGAHGSLSRQPRRTCTRRETLGDIRAIVSSCNFLLGGPSGAALSAWNQYPSHSSITKLLTLTCASESVFDVSCGCKSYHNADVLRDVGSILEHVPSREPSYPGYLIGSLPSPSLVPNLSVIRNTKRRHDQHTSGSFSCCEEV